MTPSNPFESNSGNAKGNVNTTLLKIIRTPKEKVHILIYSYANSQFKHAAHNIGFTHLIGLSHALCEQFRLCLIAFFKLSCQLAFLTIFALLFIFMH